ncbi:hypothetical protein J4470_01615 [Candidatus Woesearchaeota archaeon]|nr:hypothetical protein [Candidatus Woesearchaeota archaeon]
MKTYQCSVCNFHYTEEKWAKECEDFCRKHSSCSLEITKHALENKGSI